jgi:hypothetical protein
MPVKGDMRSSRDHSGEVTVQVFNGVTWVVMDDNSESSKVVEEGFEKCDECDGTGYVPIAPDRPQTQTCRKCWGTGQLTWLEKIFGKEPPPQLFGTWGSSGTSGYAGFSGVSGSSGAAGLVGMAGWSSSSYAPINSSVTASPITPGQIVTINSFGSNWVSLNDEKKEVKKDVFSKLKDVYVSSKKFVKGVIDDNGAIFKFML